MLSSDQLCYICIGLLVVIIIMLGICLMKQSKSEGYGVKSAGDCYNAYKADMTKCNKDPLCQFNQTNRRCQSKSTVEAKKKSMLN